jgi:hypothetical protein
MKEDLVRQLFIEVPNGRGQDVLTIAARHGAMSSSPLATADDRPHEIVLGAAGALNLCQSERSSLVSGAATGMLVAASLAPQAGLIRMGAAIGEWEMRHRRVRARNAAGRHQSGWRGCIPHLWSGATRCPLCAWLSNATLP